MINIIINRIETAIQLKQSILETQVPAQLAKLTDAAINTIRSKNKIMLCGNGGSATDAQHMAAELVNRFYVNREPMAAIALTTDIAIISSIANDFSYDDIFSKQVQALGKRNDMLIALSTSGKSKNIINAAKIAKDTNILTVGFTGKSPNPLSDLADIAISVPTNDVPRIQEIHYMLLHIMCEIVEKELFDVRK